MTDRNALPNPPDTGRRNLDVAHRRLQSSMEDLRRALERGTREEAMTCTVGLLARLRADYLGEESLMRRSAFPDLDRHLEAHATLESGFVALVRRIRDGGPDLGSADRDALRAVLRRLAGDLAAHVRSADCVLARFLDSAGVSDLG
jgi:hemerythrin